MRLRQIEIFYHVYRTGSISGAARDLNVSQPSVSKVLRHAEDQLGIDLFLRQKGRLVPTPAADELFREAEDIYRRLTTFNRSLENIRSRKGGHLRLGVLPSLSLSVGPDLIARLHAHDPKRSFELTTLHSSDIAEALLEKRADMCIGFSEVEDSRIESVKVGMGHLVLVSGHQLAKPGARIDEKILHGADFIGARDSGPLGKLVSELLVERGVEPREVATAHTYHVALSLVRKRVGLALTDQFTAYSHLGSGLHRYRLEALPQFSIYSSVLKDHPSRDELEGVGTELEKVISDIEAGIARLQPPKP